MTAAETAIGMFAGRKAIDPASELMPLAAAVEAPPFLQNPPPSEGAIDAILWKMRSDPSKSLMAITDRVGRLAVIGRETNVDLYDPGHTANLESVHAALLLVKKSRI